MQNKNENLVCYASYSNGPDTWTPECLWVALGKNNVGYEGEGGREIKVVIGR